MQVGQRKKRSPGSPDSGRLTRLVQTHVTPAVGQLLGEKISKLRVKEAAYLRTLIERDLGVLASEDPDHG